MTNSSRRQHVKPAAINLGTVSAAFKECLPLAGLPAELTLGYITGAPSDRERYAPAFALTTALVAGTNRSERVKTQLLQEADVTIAGLSSWTQLRRNDAPKFRTTKSSLLAEARQTDTPYVNAACAILRVLEAGDHDAVPVIEDVVCAATASWRRFNHDLPQKQAVSTIISDIA